MAANLNAAERAYFIRKLGGTQPAGKPLNQIKREYFVSFTGAATPQVSINELEYRWQLKVLADAGVTPAAMEDTDDLWRAMVATLSVTPSNWTTDNMLKWYLNAP